MKKHMMNSIITVIPHANQRYNTAGDFKKINDSWVEFTISQMNNPDYEFMVSIHEQIEQYITRKRGITEERITQWDLDNIEHPDPGNMEGCPYFKEHAFATKIEKLICEELGLDWDEYDKSFQQLEYKKEV